MRPCPALYIRLLALAILLQLTLGQDAFVSFGCWGGEVKSRGRQKKVGELMQRVSEREGVRYAVAAGDNFYKKGVLGVDDPRWVSTFAAVYPEGVKFYAALGNHDYRGDIWAQVNYTKAAPLRWQLPYPYYSFTEGVGENAVNFFVIDTVLLERCVVNKAKIELYKTRCWDDMKQWEWLQKKLNEPIRGWKIVVGHYPLHANGPHDNKKWLVDMLSPLFERSNVSLYINADNHYLQYSLSNEVCYLNSGGGAGYMPHTPHDKGYRVSPTSQWTYFADGIFLHRHTAASMTIEAHTPSEGLVHNFTIPNRNHYSVGYGEGSSGGGGDKKLLDGNGGAVSVVIDNPTSGGVPYYLTALTCATLLTFVVLFRPYCRRRRRG